MNLKKLLNELNNEYVLIFNEKLLDINSFNNSIISFVVTGGVVKIESDTWLEKDIKDAFNGHEMIYLSVDHRFSIQLIHRSEPTNIEKNLLLTLSEMFRYNLSDNDHCCYSDYNNIDCYIELYKDYAYYNILLGGASYRSSYIDYEDVERKIPPVQFLDNEINEKFRAKFIEVVDNTLENKKREKIEKNKKVENIENSKILSVAYSSILSVKTLCFEKDGKKVSVNTKDLNTKSFSILLKNMGEFLSKDSTAIITTNCNSSVKDVYAIDINYLISNTTVKKDSEDLKYITINRKRFYIDDSAIEILYDTGKKVGIDETKLSSWLLLAAI